MQKKEIKSENEASLTDNGVLSLETEQGIKLYLFSKTYDHPINQKIKFTFGQVNVFMEKQGIRGFKCDMISTDSLNQSIEWDQRYFDKIKSFFKKAEKDYIYSLIKSTGEEPIPCDYVLYFSEKIKAGNNVTILRLFLLENPQFSNLEYFFKQCNEAMNKKDRVKNLLEEKLIICNQQKDRLASDIELISCRCKERETTLLKKFVLLLNEKKNQLCKLTQMKGLFENEIIEEENVQNLQQQQKIIEEKPFNNNIQIKVKQQQQKEEYLPSQLIVSQQLDQIDIDSILFSRDDKYKKELNGQAIKKTKI